MEEEWKVYSFTSLLPKQDGLLFYPSFQGAFLISLRDDLLPIILQI